MNYNNKVRLHKMLKTSYSEMMIPIYKEFRDFDSVEVRLETVQWINSHNHSKLVEQYGKRKYRRKAVKKIKQELETLKVKDELENFLEI